MAIYKGRGGRERRRKGGWDEEARGERDRECIPVGLPRDEKAKVSGMMSRGAPYF